MDFSINHGREIVPMDAAGTVEVQHDTNTTTANFIVSATDISDFYEGTQKVFAVYKPPCGEVAYKACTVTDDHTDGTTATQHTFSWKIDKSATAQSGTVKVQIVICDGDDPTAESATVRWSSLIYSLAIQPSIY